MQSPVRMPSQNPLQQGTSLTQQQSMAQKAEHPKTKRKISLRGLWNTRSLLVFVAILQVVMIILIINPTTILQQFHIVHQTNSQSVKRQQRGKFLDGLFL